jgi:hypothetical protein
MTSLWSGAGNAADELGRTLFVLTEMKENPTTLELDDGLMWIGAKAEAKDGNTSFPIGTGLVHVAPGEYRLRFELTPTGSIEGRVRGGPAGRELFVALARGGELLTLDVRQREMRSLCALGADGYYRFPLVPAGALELRVGTREELATGRWTKREEFQLARGAKLALDVQL